MNDLPSPPQTLSTSPIPPAISGRPADVCTHPAAHPASGGSETVQRKVQHMFRHCGQDELTQALVRCVLEYHLERGQNHCSRQPLEPAA